MVVFLADQTVSENKVSVYDQELQMSGRKIRVLNRGSETQQVKNKLLDLAL